MSEAAPAAENPLVTVCRLLNRHHAAYVVCGGQAVILHGHVRTTEDVDLMIGPTEENARRVLAALSELPDGVARELQPRELLDNVVVKIADAITVDVGTRAWKVGYEEAAPKALMTTIEGVEIHYLDLASLIASKETYREIDRLDIVALRMIEAERRRQAESRTAGSEGPKWPC